MPAHACAKCGGQWVGARDYFQWLEGRGEGKGEAKSPVAAGAPAGAQASVAGASGPPARDTTRAKLCPQCGRLLTRAKVGHGVELVLDHCGGCGGFWFDAHEWEVLRGRGLHDEVHFVFSDAWQAEVARQERDAAHQRLLRQRLGEADYGEIHRVKAWLDAHPHRAELYAVLLADFDPERVAAGAIARKDDRGTR